jgi:hypothetical protein
MAFVDPNDSMYGPAVREFQDSVGLEADGLFGPDSLDAYRTLYGEPSRARRGFDISRWQAGIDVAAIGRDFVVIKALEGVGPPARCAASHTRAAQSAELEYGHYHYATPETNGENDACDEAELFVSTVEDLGWGTLRCALDLENKGYKIKKRADGTVKRIVYGADLYQLWREDRPAYRARITEWACTWVERYHQLTGHWPLLYSYTGYLNKRVDPVQPLTRCGLWLAAHCEGRDPRVVYHIDPRWKLVCVQYSSSGDEESRRVWNHGLDLNLAPWGLSAVRY